MDDLYARLKDRVEVVEGLNDASYGNREFIIRDLNRFWITFGQPSVFEVLMTGVREGNTEVVRVTLERGGVKPETLTAALAVASAGDNVNAEIAELLKQAGAVPPPEVDAEILQSYVGQYKGEQGIEFNVTVKDGTLFATLGGQQPLSLLAVDQTTFRPTAFDNDGIVTFNVDAGQTTGCTVIYGTETMQLKRVEETE